MATGLLKNQRVFSMRLANDLVVQRFENNLPNILLDENEYKALESNNSYSKDWIVDENGNDIYIGEEEE